MSDERRTLVLLRHAKSDYPAGVGDHERPLASRGEREAGLAGDWLRQSVTGPPVQAVLCSSATRTRQTLERTGLDVPVHYLDRLYGAAPGAIIDEINKVDSAFDFDVDTLLVVGHEPAMSGLALGLAASEGTNHSAAERVSTKYPTSAMAVLKFTGPWSSLELGSAALVTFYVPR
ncbi:MAG: histidine phosphatase family protein [Mycobacterium sp.]|nr:histidine phosphatase family protein [Mycobacterium sp.]